MTLGLEGPLLTLSLKPQRGKLYQFMIIIINILRDCLLFLENVWAQDDLDTLSRFFKKEVCMY